MGTYRKYWLQWAGATAFGWLVSLSIAALPVFAKVEHQPLGAAPYFCVLHQGRVVNALVFLMIGFINSLPQWWLLRRRFRSAGLWIAAAGAGVLVGVTAFEYIQGGDWLGRNPPWEGGLVASAIPVAVLQSLVLVYWTRHRVRATVGLYWIVLRPASLVLPLCVGGVFYLGSAATSSAWAHAFWIAVWVGLPFGLASGLWMGYLMKIFPEQ